MVPRARLAAVYYNYNRLKDACNEIVKAYYDLTPKEQIQKDITITLPGWVFRWVERYARHKVTPEHIFDCGFCGTQMLDKFGYCVYCRTAMDRNND